MKRVAFILFSILLTGFTSYAQTLDKVKGNKNVITQTTETEAFHTLIIDDDFEVSLIFNQTPLVTIDTDDNLFPYIIIDEHEGVLSLKKTAKLITSKGIIVKINYNNELTNIKVKDKAQVSAPTPIDLENLTLIAEGSSKVDLHLKTDTFTFQSNEKSRVKLDAVCKKAMLTLSQTSKLEGLFYSKETSMELYDKANVSLNGETDSLNLKTDNDAQFNGKEFLIKTCLTTNETSSDVYLNVLETLTMEASGSSSVNVYNSPKIIINRFDDTAKLQKKAK
ncbi:MAG: GIN domain-containing protein [Flavobacteriaceae bacterium]